MYGWSKYLWWRKSHSRRLYSKYISVQKPDCLCVAFGWRLHWTLSSAVPWAWGQSMKVPCNPSQERQVIRDWGHSPPPPPNRAGWAETPYPPPQDIPLPPGNYPSGTSLGGNLTSASKSASEVIVLTQDERGEYFWLNGTSLRGQAAELETSAGWPARFSIVFLYSESRKSGWAGTTRTNPWQAGTGQELIKGGPLYFFLTQQQH
jgi:hypothetical protein